MELETKTVHTARQPAQLPVLNVGARAEVMEEVTAMRATVKVK